VRFKHPFNFLRRVLILLSIDTATMCEYQHRQKATRGRRRASALRHCASGPLLSMRKMAHRVPMAYEHFREVFNIAVTGGRGREKQ
jgi:hypothetical protein